MGELDGDEMIGERERERTRAREEERERAGPR